MKKKISEAEKLLKYFTKMSDAIRLWRKSFTVNKLIALLTISKQSMFRNGEDTYSLDDANLLRVKILKLHENIDAIRFEAQANFRNDSKYYGW